MDLNDEVVHVLAMVYEFAETNSGHDESSDEISDSLMSIR